MPSKHLDLFSEQGVQVERGILPVAMFPDSPSADFDDDALLRAILASDLKNAPNLAVEAGRRGLKEAVPVLEEDCRRFAGFGIDQVIPEQMAALQALTAIGGLCGETHEGSACG